MNLLTSVWGVIVALAIVGTATEQKGEKRTIKRLTMFLIDAKTKGVSEQTVTTGSPRVANDQGTRTWCVFYAESDVAADSSPENIAHRLNRVGRRSRLILEIWFATIAPARRMFIA